MIIERAIETHKALYGTDPIFSPHRDASHHPFGGVDEELMKSLVDQNAVKKHLQNWKKEMKRNWDSPLKVGDFVTVYKNRRKGIVWEDPVGEAIKVLNVEDLEEMYKKNPAKCLSISNYPNDKVKRRIPEYGEVDFYQKFYLVNPSLNLTPTLKLSPKTIAERWVGLSDPLLRSLNDADIDFWVADSSLKTAFPSFRGVKKYNSSKKGLGEMKYRAETYLQVSVINK